MPVPSSTPPTTTAAHSLWLEQPAEVRYAPPRDERAFDVLVLGGGITGLTTALLLKGAGVRVAVVECAQVGSGATGNNTAKVTALQSTMLSQIKKVRGADVAAAYASGSAAAVEKVAELVERERIECDFRRRDAFTVAADDSELSSVEREFAAAQRAGLPVEMILDVDLPYEVVGAVRLAGQVAIHPVNYARGLATAIDGGGSRVFEDTRALAVHEDDPVRVETDHGPLTGDQVVVATHYRCGTEACTSRGWTRCGPTAWPPGSAPGNPSGCPSRQAARPGPTSPAATW